MKLSTVLLILAHTDLLICNVLSATLTTQIHAKLKHGFLVIVIAGILYTIV